MNQTSTSILASALAAFTLFGCARSAIGSGGEGGSCETSSPPDSCDSAADCDPSVDPCFVGACSVFHRCIFKPSCLPAPDCPVNECDPAAGEYPGKVACDDGEAHTADRCVDAGSGCGVCAHVEVECDQFDPIKVQQATCDDDDPCTADRCKEPNVCDHLPISNCP